MKVALHVAIVAAALAAAPASAQEASHNFSCDFVLITNQNPLQMSAPTPVSIAFDESDSELASIRVIDEGGILYPAGNMRFVEGEDANRLEAVEMPAERPGIWTGLRSDDQFSFSLSHEGAEVVTFVLTIEPQNDDGDHIVLWNASNQISGLPDVMRGNGAGYCQPSEVEEAAQ